MLKDTEEKREMHMKLNNIKPQLEKVEKKRPKSATATSKPNLKKMASSGIITVATQQNDEEEFGLVPSFDESTPLHRRHEVTMAKVYFNRGIVHIHIGNDPAALADFGAALKVEPKDKLLARGIKSTNLADALIMAIYKPTVGASLVEAMAARKKRGR